MRMSLRQKFYSISHDSSTSVNTFIEAVLSITRQLRAINHAPSDEEIMDKILVSLDPTFASIRAVLCLRTPAPSLSEVQNALVEFETQLGSAAAAKAGGYEVLYAGRSSSKANDKGNFDWTNTQRKDSVCWRCGRAKHTAQYCVADMPEDIKRKVLSRSRDQHANIATPSPPVHDPITNDPSALFMLHTDIKSRSLGRRTRPGSVRSLLRRLHLAASAFLEDFWIELCINFVFEPAFRTVKPWERFLYLAHPITFVRALANPPLTIFKFITPCSSFFERALGANYGAERSAIVYRSYETHDVLE
ncbi:hypothetical protein CCMSSC00406_0010116 [Pleurotus cornucopiae]|uniref:Uncharacterized protein n=1 Tax=Pleurotus cornucopiae TaxID=5321 RepID=A0ACB7IIP4_PLECO|nr:hypothetical protein CCMSSC00406_0010116 [Pleurotus cornucopiae]